MLLFVHLITHSFTHQTFFFGLISSNSPLGEAEMRTLSPCPEEPSPEGDRTTGFFTPQTPANKPPSPASALIPRAVFLADIAGGSRGDCRLGDDIFD